MDSIERINLKDKSPWVFRNKDSYIVVTDKREKKAIWTVLNSLKEFYLKGKDKVPMGMLGKRGHEVSGIQPCTIKSATFKIWGVFVNIKSCYLPGQLNYTRLVSLNKTGLKLMIVKIKKNKIIFEKKEEVEEKKEEVKEKEEAHKCSDCQTEVYRSLHINCPKCNRKLRWDRVK